MDSSTICNIFLPGGGETTYVYDCNTMVLHNDVSYT